MSTLVSGSAVLLAALAITGLILLAFGSSIEWSVNGLPRRRDRVVVALLDAFILSSAWILAATSLGSGR